MITIFWKHSYTVQNNTGTEKIDDSKISEIQIPESNSKTNPNIIPIWTLQMLEQISVLFYPWGSKSKFTIRNWINILNSFWNAQNYSPLDRSYNKNTPVFNICFFRKLQGKNRKNACIPRLHKLTYKSWFRVLPISNK